MRFALLAMCCVLAPVCSPAPGIVRADDWLAIYPECAFPSDAQALGRMAVLYPRFGFPALVEAGDRLVARVRVPSGLTPPPGIQQDRALLGWSAELVGQTMQRMDDFENRYDLRVADVRPDGGSSLVYRATIRIPAWAAPGTYSLELSAPGGSENLPSAVRILEPGATPRIAAVEALDVEAFPDGIAPWASPVDVFLVDSRNPVLRERLGDRRVPPFLYIAPDGPAVALRVGAGGLLVLGGCDRAGIRFADAVAGIERSEQRRSYTFERASLSGGRLERLLDGTPVEWRSETTAVHPLDFGVSYAEDTRASFHPATCLLSTTSTPAVAARVHSGTNASPRLVRANLPPVAIVFDPAEPEAGPVQMRLSRTGWHLVAWQLDEDVTALGPEITHAFSTVGLHEIRALAIRADGAAILASAELEVRPQRTEGCEGCTASGGTSVLPEVVLATTVLLQTRRRRKYNARSRSF